MTTTDHAIVAPAVTGDPGTRDDAGGFDPGRPPFRTRDGREVAVISIENGWVDGWVDGWKFCWKPNGMLRSSASNMDLMNAAPDPIPQPEGDAPPASGGMMTARITLGNLAKRRLIIEQIEAELLRQYEASDWEDAKDVLEGIETALIFNAIKPLVFGDAPPAPAQDAGPAGVTEARCIPSPDFYDAGYHYGKQVGAAQEREACAKGLDVLAENERQRTGSTDYDVQIDAGAKMEALETAAACVRARARTPDAGKETGR